VIHTSSALSKNEILLKSFFKFNNSLALSSFALCPMRQAVRTKGLHAPVFDGRLSLMCADHQQCTNFQWRLSSCKFRGVAAFFCGFQVCADSLSSKMQICHAREPSCISSTECEVRSECAAFNGASRISAGTKACSIIGNPFYFLVDN